jgi:asparagine synthetase B (glutamine-hydrolysing)
VFLSGGIDSTVALSALIMTNNDYRNRITVYTSEYSIQNEYPLFFDMFVKDMDYILLKDDDFFTGVKNL